MTLGVVVLVGGAVLLVALLLVVVRARSRDDVPARAEALPERAAMDEPRPITPAAPDAVRSDDAPNAPVPITHPLIRRAVETALEQNSPIRYYVFRAGPDLFFSFEQMADEHERRQAYQLMRRLETGDDVDLRAMLQLIQKLTRAPGIG